MSFLLALIFSLSSNLDNFVIGLSYGVKNERISLTANGIIAFITAFITFISMLGGKLITHIIPNYVSNELGSAIFILMGSWFIGSDLLQKKKQQQKQQQKQRTVLNFKGAVMLGLLLSINNIGVGILGSITHLDITLVVTLTFITGIFLTYAGNHIGHSVIGNIVGKYNNLISGSLLIILGILSLLFKF
ncbi:manganese efflux pump MntP family protein [Photobacterium iliopiscarium]|uniref:manganese efflux pump MntP n=1 Tax=Photobacterium iliopiscarium TaxID=56192 RepID=UPI00242FF0FF|nr:manganese efflux pump [Photobacterium iliopiscarium]